MIIVNYKNNMKQNKLFPKNKKSTLVWLII
jgi:hypothetical protein